MSFFLSRHNVERIAADLQGRFYVTDYSMGDAVVDTYFGEMNLAGVDKGSGIRHILEATGASVRDTIGIGDSRNDLEMLEFVGTPVAMGNATEPIKRMAHLITSAVDEDGIYNAFLSLGLL
jgi:hydroxymethylpyrimidine pyrophosphatase-like HAD family hydrolase